MYLVVGLRAPEMVRLWEMSVSAIFMSSVVKMREDWAFLRDTLRWGFFHLTSMIRAGEPKVPGFSWNKASLACWPLTLKVTGTDRTSTRYSFL